jgi:carboxyl-terminal processing protease
MTNRNKVLLLLVLSVGITVHRDASAQRKPPSRKQPTTATQTTPPAAKPASRGFLDEAGEKLERDFAEALTLIEENYIDGNKLHYNDIFKSSIIGMLRTLDPHSNFYDAKEFDEMKTDWRSEYYGIGTSIGDRKVNGITSKHVLAVFENSPALKAGLRFGDRIIEVDGQSMESKTSAEVRDKIRGPQGTSVRLAIERASDGQRQNLEIKREAVPQPTVPDAYLIRPGLGYIDLTRGFNYTTADEFTAALEELHKQGATSLVIDLRGNPGGFLDQAILVVERFLVRGQNILTQKGRHGLGERSYESSNRNPDKSPLAMLVNRGTASGAEIVVGALQDHDRALIVGETTFGKGLVQGIFPLGYGTGTALSLTVSKYYTPSGRLIQRDYSNGGFYDYFTRDGLKSPDQNSADAKPTGPQSHTDAGRPIYGGNGTMPDEVVKPRTPTSQQIRLIDPIFAFVRELVNGRIAGFENYKRQGGIDFNHNILTADFPVTDDLFQAFEKFATKVAAQNLTKNKFEAQREFITRQLRYDLATAFYGITKASQILIADDPQVLRAIEALPRAAKLSTLAQDNQVIRR